MLRTDRVAATLAVTGVLLLTGCVQNLAGVTTIARVDGRLEVRATGCGQEVEVLVLDKEGPDLPVPEPTDDEAPPDSNRLSRVALPAPADPVSVLLDPGGPSDGGLGAPLAPDTTYSVGAGAQDFSTPDLVFTLAEVQALGDGEMLVPGADWDSSEIRPLAQFDALCAEPRFARPGE